MISEERIKTNHMLLTELDMWDEFTVKSINDEWTLRYYNYIMNLLNSQVDEAINWLDSDDARELFFGEAKYQQELFRALEDEWDEILESKYPSVEALLDEVYRRGKSKGYAEMREHIRFTDTDKLALDIVRNYNFHLISKLDNDTRNQIKNIITSAVLSGENPRSLAPKIRDTVGTRLEGSTFTPMQRATMIAKTEISRAQNTGILQSYINEGYIEVKILTAEDNNVCYTCLTYAYEFNEESEIIFSNHGEEKVHNIIELLKGGMFPPFHPTCRCTYLSIWRSKGEPPEVPYIINLTPSSYDGLNGLFNSLMLRGDHELSVERIPPLNEKFFKEEIKGFVDESDIDLLTNFLKSFRDQVPNVYYEFGAANLFGSIHMGFGDWERNIKIPKVLKKFGIKYNIPILIHNHPITISLFPSPEDFETYSKYGVHYGITTNEFGTFIVKNNNIDINMTKYPDIKSVINKIKIGILIDFKTKYGYKFDKNNSTHVKDINQMINDHFDKYFDQYQEALSNYDMEVLFIKP